MHYDVRFFAMDPPKRAKTITATAMTSDDTQYNDEAEAEAEEEGEEE